MGTLFLTQLAGGCLLMAAACRRDQVATSWLRLISRIAFVMLVVVAVLAATSGVAPLTLGCCIAAGLGTLFWMMSLPRAQVPPPRIERVVGFAASTVTLAAAVLLMRETTTAGIPAVSAERSVLAAVSVMLGAAILGCVTDAMLLGHAYLTHTAMPIDPLRRLSRILLALLGARLVWAVAIVLGFRAVLTAPPGNVMWFWLMLSVRIGAGLMGLAVLAWMVRDCVLRRSTQSATGILYISMVFAFLGELAALDLVRSFGLPV